jgi:MFS family permease
MICCLTLEWLALGVWVGGLLVLIGAVIPAVFNTFGGQDSGGLFLTRAFEGYHRFIIGALAIMWAALWYRWWSGDPTVAVGRGEMMSLAGMVVIAGIIIGWLHPYASALQAQVFAVHEEAAKKAAFEALFRILIPVRWLYMINLVLGILLVGIKVKRSLYRSEVLM